MSLETHIKIVPIYLYMSIIMSHIEEFFKLFVCCAISKAYECDDYAETSDAPAACVIVEIPLENRPAEVSPANEISSEDEPTEGSSYLDKFDEELYSEVEVCEFEII